MGTLIVILGLAGAAVGIYYWLSKRAKRKAEGSASEEGAAQAARDFAERQRPIEERLASRGYGTIGRSTLYRSSQAAPVAPPRNDSGFDPLMAGVIGYAIGSMNSGSHTHSTITTDDAPVFTGGGGDTAGSGAGSSWSDDRSSDSSSSSSDSSSSSSDSGSSDSGGSSSSSD